MKIAIIDADLIGREKHRFPNLVCEKISGYHKKIGDEVHLVLDYDNLDSYDEVYICKVFTDTWVPDWIANNVNMDGVSTSLPENIHVGGTGFFFATAPNLPEYIEHHMPDYHLYDEWIEGEVAKAREAKGEDFNEKSFLVQFKEYLDYSIGFITRGCFRKCPFCVNQKYDHVFLHSPLEEFHDPTRKKLCFLDDNFLGSPNWKSLLTEIINTGKPFKFKQGLDERLLTDAKCELLFSAKYDGDYTFAFDNVKDYKLIKSKLEMIRRHTDANRICFYVLVGFESTDEVDIENAFKRIALLLHYRCLPYLMRYMNKNDAPWKRSRFRSLYISMARWCNQPSILKKMTFREFCVANQKLHKTEGTLCSAMQAMTDFENDFPEIASRYFDIRYGEHNPNI